VIPNTRDRTWKVEYLYIDLGHFGASGIDTVLGTYSWRTHVTDHIARVGVNYRFRESALFCSVERIVASPGALRRGLAFFIRDDVRLGIDGGFPPFRLA
jgi:hypothetical protein